VEIPAFAEDADGGRFGFEEGPDVGIVFDGVFGKARGAEGGKARMLELHVFCALEEIFVLGIGVGPAAFDVIDTELVELLGNNQLVVDGKGDGFALGAVAKSGIECLDAHGTTWLPRRLPALAVRLPPFSSCLGTSSSGAVPCRRVRWADPWRPRAWRGICGVRFCFR